MWAALIPGFRHSRTPLVAGVMWLLLAWLLLGEERLIPDASGGPVESDFARLIELAGPAATLAALGLTALLIGGLIPTISRSAASWMSTAAGRVVSLYVKVPYIGLVPLLTREWFSPISGTSRGIPGDDGVEICYGIAYDLVGRADVEHWKGVANDLAAPSVLREATDKALLDHMSPLAAEQRAEPGANVYERYSDANLSVDVRQQIIAEAIEAEFDDLAVLLQIGHENLYLEVDRLTAESELRRAIFFPGLALACVLAAKSTDCIWTFVPLAILLMVVPVLLLWNGVISQREAQVRVFSAVKQRLVSSPTVGYLTSMGK